MSIYEYKSTKIVDNVRPFSAMSFKLNLDFEKSNCEFITHCE